VEDGRVVANPMPSTTDFSGSSYGIGNLPIGRVCDTATSSSMVTGRPIGGVMSRLGYDSVLGLGMTPPGEVDETSEEDWFAFLDPVPMRVGHRPGQAEASLLLGDDAGRSGLSEAVIYPDYCCFSWLAALMCFWPVGICAVFLSIQTAEEKSLCRP